MWSTDTDVVLLFINLYEEINNEVWIRIGVKDHKRYIPVHNIQTVLTPQICKYLLSVHALSGCDSVSSLCGQGKVKMWQLVKSNPDAYIGILDLSQAVEIEPRKLTSVDKLFMDMYKKRGDGELPADGINALRYPTLLPRS